MSKMIPLTKGKFAIVDDSDFEWLIQWKWSFDDHYATRNDWSKKVMIRMHRAIMNTPAGMETDHINGDKLDNRRSNLRICTTSENKANVGRQPNNTSGYKGVHWHKSAHKWQARIKIIGKYKHLGLFETAEAAAYAYDKAAKEAFGEFAQLNFPEP